MDDMIGGMDDNVLLNGAAGAIHQPARMNI
jgi:hypothetical protein